VQQCTLILRYTYVTNNSCCLIWFWTWPESSPQVWPIFEEPLFWSFIIVVSFDLKLDPDPVTKIDMFNVGLFSKPSHFSFQCFFYCMKFPFIPRNFPLFSGFFRESRSRNFAKISRNNIKITKYESNFSWNFIPRNFVSTLLSVMALGQQYYYLKQNKQYWKHRSMSDERCLNNESEIKVKHNHLLWQ
jgi:hypothetical protein